MPYELRASKSSIILRAVNVAGQQLLLLLILTFLENGGPHRIESTPQSAQYAGRPASAARLDTALFDWDLTFITIDRRTSPSRNQDLLHNNEITRKTLQPFT
ncbi:hypothetical protein EVAR_59644_1 [Eumeta japonica]|uniref:Uncharacterized protein n=1 Tax=Eumeta variegata TaxID=151549 RepID=A0A4C1YJF0_EUMVA|nr:hypothetical protein EVAR_59644_1 [Eumeta japonica]